MPLPLPGSFTQAPSTRSSCSKPYFLLSFKNKFSSLVL